MPSQWWASTSPYATSIRSCWICFPSATRTRATRSGRKRMVGWLLLIFWTSRSLPFYLFVPSPFLLSIFRERLNFCITERDLNLCRDAGKNERGRRDKRIITAFLPEMWRRCCLSPTYLPQFFFLPFCFFFHPFFPHNPPPLPAHRLSPLALSLLFLSLHFLHALSVGAQEPYETGLAQSGCGEKWSTIWQSV